MIWNEATTIEELTVCPWCTGELPSGTVRHKACTCGCKVFELPDKMWYRIPDDRTAFFVDALKFAKYIEN